jgi:GT2 family glycosyltransferase
VQCSLKGLSTARNAGLAVASGEVISFLDDDAIAKPDWLEQTWAAFEKHPNAGVVGGTIELVLPEPRPRWAKAGWEKYWSHFAPSVLGAASGRPVQHWWEYPWGANWSARHQALLEIGGFRRRYGRRGYDFGGGEELNAALLIGRLGYEIVVNPLAKVLHQPEANRFTFTHVWRTIRSGKKIEYQLQKELYLPMSLGIRWFLRNIARNLKKAFGLRHLLFHQRIEYLLHLWAELGLLGWYLIDRLKRFRKSFVMRT